MSKDAPAAIQVRANASYKICFVVGSVGPGGAERVVATLANYWVETGWDVEVLVYTDGTPEGPFYELNPRVELRHLFSARLRLPKPGRVLRRLWKLRRAILKSKPDVVVAIMFNAAWYSLAALIGRSVPVVAADHADPRMPMGSRLEEMLRPATYSRAGALVCLLDAHAARYGGRRVLAIPNPVAAPPIECLSHFASLGDGRPVIVNVGRLDAVKAHQRLIDAFGRVASAHADWDMVIYGEGPERNRLEAQIAELGLIGRVSLPGRTTQPYMALAAAKIFALSSEYEAFPMALCEALSVGLPVVAFHFELGESRIIREGIDGFVVPQGDIAAMALALDKLMSDPALFSEMSRRAVEIVDRFGIEAVTARWSALFAELTGHASPCPTVSTLNL